MPDSVAACAPADRAEPTLSVTQEFVCGEGSGKFETEVPGGTVIAQSGSVEYHTTDRNFVLSFDYAAQVRPMGVGEVIPILNELRNGHSDRGSAFSGVEFRELYPGISVDLENTRGRLIVRIRLAPAARPDDIAVRYIGVRPAFIGENGALGLAWGAILFDELQPVMYRTPRGRP